MSWLGTVLDLPEGTRLTGIELHPVDDETEPFFAGSVTLTIAYLGGDCEPEVAGPAACRFLPGVIASLHGVLPDGAAWIACLQLVPVDADEVTGGNVAAESVLRALALTGLLEEDLWSHDPFEAGHLSEVVTVQSGVDVHHWDVSSLVTAVLVELTNASLADVVPEADSRPPRGANVVAHRRERLRGHLDSWAAFRD